MRVVVLAIPLWAACAHGPPTSEAAITAQTHRLFDAAYRGDATTFAAMTTPNFVRFENEKVSTRAEALERMKPKPPSLTQVWKDEHVFLHDREATFVGMAVEHETGNDSHGNREYDGWYTVSWVQDGGAWKAVNWTWQAHRSSTDAARDLWNDNFRQDIGFEHKPNHLLATAIEGVKPGLALDVATGQGRNAVFLATQGWTVTAIDIADEGLRRAREAATAQHVALDAVQADVETYDYGVAKWDLVTLIYAGDTDTRLTKIKAAIKPGGLFVVEYFLDDGDGGFKPGQLAKKFGEGYDILRDEVVEDHPDWGVDKAKLVRFIARRRQAR